MPKIMREKFTADVKEPFVFFMTGGHVNNLFMVHKWLPVVWNFIKLTRYVTTHPETGCLGGHLYFRVRPFGMILHSYWRSSEDLETFARSAEEGHLSVWENYMQHVSENRAMAIYHEMYLVEADKFKAIYINSTPVGLAKAMGAIPITSRQQHAHERINPKDESVSEEPLVPIPTPDA
jgi:Monooxygenase af470-like